MGTKRTAAVLFATLTGLAACAGTTPDAAGPSGTAPVAEQQAQAASAGLPLAVQVGLTQLWVDGQPATLDELEAEMGHRVAAGAGARVVVSAAGEVPFAEIARVVEGLKRAGAVRVELAVQAVPVAAAPEAVAVAEAATAQKPAPPAAPAPPPVEAPESLPAVRLKNIGLHVGGGKNTDKEKAPFRAAVKTRFDDFRACYRHVDKPGAGGIFGVDLRVPRAGGRPKVSQPRTGMGGKKFKECMARAFGEVEFSKPSRGAAVISYSLRFTIE